MLWQWPALMPKIGAQLPGQCASMASQSQLALPHLDSLLVLNLLSQLVLELRGLLLLGRNLLRLHVGLVAPEVHLSAWSDGCHRPVAKQKSMSACIN